MSERDDMAGLLTTCNLPGEVMMEILSRLSVKTLVKFTSVCKTWRALIKNEAFIDLHFRRSASIDNEHYRITRGNKIANVTDTYFVTYDNELEKVHLNVGMYHTGLVCVVGSCHGLICTTPNDFVMLGNSFIIYNPALRQIKEIFKYRKHEALRAKKSHFISVAFGYDSRVNDYKIVRVEQYEVNNEIQTFCDIYSKKSGSWRRITVDGVNGTLVERISRANVSGYFHWLAKRDGGAYILSFNISDETFGEISLPKRGHDKYFNLHVSKQRLALIYYLVEPRENMRIEVWWMKVYGQRRSWAKEHVVGPNPDFYLILSSRDNGQYMFINHKTENVYIYDHNTNEAKHVALPGGMPGSFDSKEVQVVTYKESLIGVNGSRKFEVVKGSPPTVNLNWKQHLPVVFLGCWWFCAYVGGPEGLKKLSWEKVVMGVLSSGVLEHVWRLGVYCVVLVGGVVMVMAFLTGCIQFFRQ